MLTRLLERALPWLAGCNSGRCWVQWVGRCSNVRLLRTLCAIVPCLLERVLPDARLCLVAFQFHGSGAKCVTVIAEVKRQTLLSMLVSLLLQSPSQGPWPCGCACSPCRTWRLHSQCQASGSQAAALCREAERGGCGRDDARLGAGRARR